MAEDSPVLGFGEPLVSCTSVEVLDLSTGVIGQCTSLTTILWSPHADGQS